MAFSMLTHHAAMRFQELAKDKTKGCRCKSMHGEPPHGHSSTAQVEMWRSGGETSWVLDLKPPPPKHRALARRNLPLQTEEGSAPDAIARGPFRSH